MPYACTMRSSGTTQSAPQSRASRVHRPSRGSARSQSTSTIRSAAAGRAGQSILRPSVSSHSRRCCSGRARRARASRRAALETPSAKGVPPAPPSGRNQRSFHQRGTAGPKRTSARPPPKQINATSARSCAARSKQASSSPFASASCSPPAIDDEQSSTKQCSAPVSDSSGTNRRCAACNSRCRLCASVAGHAMRLLAP